VRTSTERLGRGCAACRKHLERSQCIETRQRHCSSAKYPALWNMAKKHWRQGRRGGLLHCEAGTGKKSYIVDREPKGTDIWKKRPNKTKALLSATPGSKGGISWIGARSTLTPGGGIRRKRDVKALCMCTKRGTTKTLRTGKRREPSWEGEQGRTLLLLKDMFD